MITTYSYLDQYKQVGAFTVTDYFADLSVSVSTSMKLTVTDSCALSYGLYPGYWYPDDGIYPDAGIAEIVIDTTGGGA